MNTRNAGPFRRLSGVIVMAVAISGATLAAHDMWIEPATFSPDTGQIVGVRLRVGHDPLGEQLSRDPPPGLMIIGYRSNPSAIEQTADKFNQYLKEEGLEAIAALRAQRNQTGAKARELFSRVAKSLLVAGSPSKAQGDRALGFTLELVAERNPYAFNAGQELPVRLIYENQIARAHV